MRHSFLPMNEQKALKKRYHIHATVVALFLLSVIGIIGIGSLFPAYVRVSFEEKIQAMALQGGAENSEKSETMEIARELQRDVALARELSDTLTNERPSTLVKDVISARAAVKIQSMSVSDISTSTATIIIQGVAPTRESLVSFKTRLEGFATGNKVELPISELAQSKDIQFSLRFTRILP